MALNSINAWHRYIGVCCALFVLTLSITGVLLQHTDSLNLPHRYLEQNWLLEWYGIRADPVTSYHTTNHWVSQTGTSIYLGNQLLVGEYKQLVGAIETEFGVIVAQDLGLTLFSHDGSLIESLSTENGLPEPVLAIAAFNGDLIAQGLQHHWKADRDFLNWKIVQQTVEWSRPSLAPDNIIKVVQNQSLGHRLNWERVILDLHSGRLFGRFGPLLMDMTAVGLILLACSGLWIWRRRR